MPTAKHKRALESFKEANPRCGRSGVIIVPIVCPPRCATSAPTLLIAEGRLETLKQLLARAISQHNRQQCVAPLAG